MTDPPSQLKILIRQRHWQKYSTFVREFQKAARAIDSALIHASPSRAQLHRWMNGQLKGLPYPDACQVLERMFPGWTAQQLFGPVASGEAEPDSPRSELTTIAERVAAGIDHSGSVSIDWGQPSQAATLTSDGAAPSEASGPAQSVSLALAGLGLSRHLPEQEIAQLASLAGHLVDLDLLVEVDIGPDGWSEVRYRHELFNLTDRPVTRIAREIWFEHTDGPLVIKPIGDNERRVTIQRTHTTPHSAKFACQVSPALRPGERTIITYSCKGGQFVSDHYWRQSVARYTRQFTLRLRHRGTSELRSCAAVEAHADGSENSADEDLVWDLVDGAVVATVVRHHLRPDQAITLWWDVSHDAAE